MSAKVTAWVWHESQAKATDFLVLLAHADESSDTGRVSASVRNIARKARVDERTVQRCRERLIELGELAGPHATDRGPGGTYVYRVLMAGQPKILQDAPDADLHAIAGGGSVPPGGGSTPPVAERHPRQSATGQTRAKTDDLGGGRAPGVAERRPSSTSTNAVESPTSDGRLPAAKRGSRLPDDWRRSPEDIKWQHGKGIPDSFARSETEQFKDYWASVPGQRGCKLDWSATWRVWMRRAWAEQPTQRNRRQTFAEQATEQRAQDMGWMSTTPAGPGEIEQLRARQRELVAQQRGTA